MAQNYFWNRRQFLKNTALASGMCLLPSTFLLGGCNGSAVNRKIAMQSAWINDAEFLGYFVAEHEGLYEKNGLDHTYMSGGPSIVSDTIVLAGKADLALTTPDTTANAIVKQKAPFKIIGTQYQKNPIGVVSLKKNAITKPADLVGKSLAVPPANVVTAQAMLKINGIALKDVRIVPYQYDPTPLLRGDVDATLDFVTNVPYTIREKGEEPSSFLLFDHGFKIFNDTVVVLEDTLKTKRKELVSWLRASRAGWNQNFEDPNKYPKLFMDSFFKGTGRTLENEIYFNKAQKELMVAPNGIFSMSQASIDANIKSLREIGLEAKAEMFDTSLLEEI